MSADVWRWATVTQASPLRVRLDGEGSALAVTPTTLVAGLAVGDRVRVHMEGRQLIVTGSVGVDTGWTALTPAAGITVSHEIAVRRIGDVTYWRGRCTGVSVAAGAEIILVPVVPSFARPPVTGYNGHVRVTTGGGTGGHNLGAYTALVGSDTELRLFNGGPSNYTGNIILAGSFAI